MPADLYLATLQHKALVQAIRDALGDDEKAILDTIEGESKIEDAIAATIRESVASTALADGLGELMERLKKRAARLHHRADRLLDAALQAAQECGVKKVRAPDFTASVGQSKGKVIIVDERDLPDDCVRVKREPNRALIRDRLLTGVNVPGAELSNPIPNWIVRIL